MLFDPRSPLQLWRHRARNCGMTHLRSASVHHLGIKGSDLSCFQRQRFRCSDPWRGSSKSPRLKLFNAHNRELLEQYAVEEVWLQSSVQRLRRVDHRFELETDEGSFAANRVVLALGPHWTSQIPDWLQPAKKLVNHLLDPSFSINTLEPGQSVAVIGGGMSSLQSALSLSRTHKVTLLIRTALSFSEFEVKSSWMGPVNGNFRKLPSEAKRAVIKRTRKAGTVNGAVDRQFRSAVDKGLIACHQLDAPQCRVHQGRVLTKDKGQTFRFDQIVLGTGFQPALHPLHRQIALELGAPLSSCNTPILDEHLQWLPGLFVAGCHAELQIGPAAGNILGARLAVERIQRASSKLRG